MTDNTRTTCVRCGKGHYKAFDLNDDIFGDLHCDNCRHHVKFNQDLGKHPSRQAQVVLNAYKEARDGNYINGEWIQDEAGQVAAALRAAADQCQIEWNYHPDYPETEWVVVASDLTAIAAELENHQ